jgi:Type I phosphodiesterase / nucleotide pyrophosphatase
VSPGCSARPPKLVLVVIDGLTPSMLEGSLGTAVAPTLTALAERGELMRATTTFPSLTPVCLSLIATGAHPDVHEIPHLVWWHRREERLVEYGSSFGAARAAGLGRTLRDTLVGMNAEHLGRDSITLFEALADAGLQTAAVNFTAYRGRTVHRSAVPLLGPVRGPERFFFYNLFRAERTGAPLSFRNRAAGTVDAYAAAVGRWLVTRDGFDFLLLYLSDYDYASHAAGPDAATDVLARCDAAVGGLVAAAGGLDDLLERYAVIVMSDHGQTPVRDVTRLGDRFRHDPETLVAASNRAAHLYRLGAHAPSVRTLAERLDGDPAVEVTLFAEDEAVVARRDGAELRVHGTADAPRLEGDASLLDQPDAVARVLAAVRCPNAGEVVVSAAPGWEFADIGGMHHRGGGSHGSLTEGDSSVPLLTVGLAASPPRSVVDVAPAILAHFGVQAPRYVLDRAA